MFLPFPKATLLVPSGPSHDPDRKHLFIVLTKPDAAHNVLIVGVASIPHQSNHDKACELARGEHAFLRHPSYVRFRGAHIVAAQSLIDSVSAGLMVVREPISDTTMERVIGGLQKSLFVSPKIRQYFSLQMQREL
jgi:hypothetical protein